MECLRSLLGYRPAFWHCRQQDQAVFYLYFPAYGRFADHYLHGTRFLEKYEKVYPGIEEESVVLSLTDVTVTTTFRVSWNIPQYKIGWINKKGASRDRVYQAKGLLQNRSHKNKLFYLYLIASSLALLVEP